MNKLIQLEELIIDTIKADDVTDISALLGNLRALKIFHTDSTPLRHLAKHCTKLEKLIFHGLNVIADHNLFTFSYFPKLTHLEINRASCSNWCHLDNQYNNQLKVLTINNLTLGSSEIARISKLRALKQLSYGEILPSSIDILFKMPFEKCGRLP